MARSEPMDGRATPTIEMSRPSRNSAPHSTTRSSQVRVVQLLPRSTTVVAAGGWGRVKEVMPSKLCARALDAQANNAETSYAQTYGRVATMGRRDDDALASEWHQLMGRYQRLMCSLDR